MILRDLPDLPPRPLTPANAEFRRHFHARWGHENAVVILFRTRQAEFPPTRRRCRSSAPGAAARTTCCRRGGCGLASATA